MSFVKKLFAPVVFGLSAVLLVASCDDLTEPVAITPDDMRPAIVTELSQQVEEDGSLVIEVQAEDPNGETMTLSITTIPQNGTAVLESSAPPLASLKTARQDDHPPAHQPETLRPEKIDTPDPDAQLQQNSNAATDRRLEATTTELPPANKTSSNSKGLSAELRIIHGAERQSATPQSDVVGRIRYTPEADFNGTDRFAFSVRNARGFASEAEVTVTVQAEPDAPRVHRGLDDINLRPGQRFTLNLRTENVFQDPDGESLTFSATSRDEAIATAEVLNDEVLTVQALNAPNQTTLIDVTATDPPGLTSATSFTVTVEAADNQPPRIAVPIADRALAIGETFEVDLVSVFVDEDGDDLTFSASSGNPGTAQAEIVAPSTLKVTMLTTGAATISVSASDGIVSIQTTFTVFLNPGVNAADDFAVTEENMPVDIDVLENDRDSNMGSLFVAGFLQQPSAGSASIIDAGRQVRYTPAPGFFGEDTFTYIASNDLGDLAQARVVITVNRANRPPDLVNPIADQTLSVGDPAFVIDLTGVFRDPDDDVLRFSAQSDQPAVAAAMLSGPELSVTPIAVGEALIIAGASDPDGTNVEVADTFAVTITPPENVPPTATDDQGETNEDTPVTIAVLANDLDPDGTLDSTSVLLIHSPGHGSAVIQQGGTITYTPDENYNGTDRFGYTVADDSGARSDTATVTITILAVNDPPIAVNDRYSVSQDDTLVVGIADGVLRNDTDAEGDQLVATLVDNVSNGTLVFNPDGSLRYTPNASFFGTDTFTYEASDGDQASNTATVELSVNETGNIPPTVTNPGNRNNLEGETVSLQIQAEDPDTPLFYSTVTLPSGLSINASTGLISGTVSDDAAGPTGKQTYNVRIFVTDARAGQTSVSFEWEIVNPAPAVINPGDQSSLEAETITPLQIQATDDDDALDFDDNGTLPPGLAINLNTGIISGTLLPNAADNSPYAVTITASDPQGERDSTMFNWSVSNPAPVVTNPGDQTNAEGETISPLLIQATDDDTLSFAATGLPDSLSIDTATGIISGTLVPDAADSSPYAVTVTASDPQGGAGNTTFQWTVTEVLSSEKDIITFSFPEETGAATINAIARTVDIEVANGTDVTNLIATFTLSAGASATISGTAQASGVTANDFTNPITYTITAEDSSTSDWTVTVTVASS